jgi:sugar O-acyltransferase (sialic acid O-acetyltransferase NeuD family)
MENPVIIFGAKGLGKVALDIFKSNGVLVYGFLDDDSQLHGKDINDIPVLGGTEDEQFLKLLGKNCEAFVAIDDSKEREFTIKMLIGQYKVMPINAIHETAWIEPSATIGHGNLIGAGVKVLTNAKLGNHNILHARVLLDYETTVGNYVQIGSGSIIAPSVTVADDVFIGVGATIVSGLTLSRACKVGAGSVVIKSVKAEETVFGMPAQSIQAHHLVK